MKRPKKVKRVIVEDDGTDLRIGVDLVSSLIRWGKTCSVDGCNQPVEVLVERDKESRPVPSHRIRGEVDEVSHLYPCKQNPSGLCYYHNRFGGK